MQISQNIDIFRFPKEAYKRILLFTSWMNATFLFIESEEKQKLMAVIYKNIIWVINFIVRTECKKNLIQ